MIVAGPSTGARHGWDKTALLNQAIERYATRLELRRLAQRLCHGVPNGNHVERARRIHSFVQRHVPYVREVIELFQDPSDTLRLGGDCDCQTILVGALWRSMKYPAWGAPVGHPLAPDHYVCRLGYPEHESPLGDGDTIWIWAETTIPAGLGETTAGAVRRLYG